MKNRVLVASSSKSGSTSEVAEAIGEEMGQRGALVDVRRAKDVEDISAYDAVIVGSPILWGKWRSEAVRFIKRHKEHLGLVPVAYFLTCLRLTRIVDEAPPAVPVYVDPLLEEPPKTKRAMSFGEKSHALSYYLDPLTKKTPQIEPISIAIFKGKLELRKLKFFDWLAMKLMTALMKQVQEGDFRNWAAVRAWAASLSPTLIKET